MTMNCKGKLFDLSRPLIMGVLNITPDSFYDGGRYFKDETILQRTKQIITENADIIDVGAFSSRPGADIVPEKIEIERLSKALKIIRDNFPDSIISVDTYRDDVASFVIKEFDVDLINDIFAGRGSKKMFKTIAKYQVPYIMMHMQGTPQNMQKKTLYDDVVLDIIKFFSERIEKAAFEGINDVIIDPGFGFGKTIEHNYQLLKRLNEFKITEKPILVGLSRKSMIYKYLNITPQESLPATIALNMAALEKGANILRVHDVAQAVQTVKVFDKLNDVI